MPRPLVSFHTTGERLPHEGSYIITNQAYVQYIRPHTHDSDLALADADPTPILFIHGGGLTGAMWETTPDRRPGWAMLASRSPYCCPVYCLDTVDSGRSQRCPDAARTAPIEHRTVEQMQELFRFGPYPGSQFPIEHVDRLAASQSARRRGKQQYEAEAKGIRDAIAEIGTCDIIAHSNGCATTCLALLDEDTRRYVRQFVMVEPAYAIVKSYDHLASIRTLMIWCDQLEKHEIWQGIMKAYERMPDNVGIWDLPAMGYKGNSHFPMHDSNSDEIGGMVLQWLKEGRSACNG